MDYISKKGWDIYDFYVDIESGTTSKRPSLQRLINDAKNKKFDVIMAKELSRLARNGELSYQIKNIAQANNIHIITLDGAINTVDSNSNMFGIYAWLYETESQNTSRRIKSAIKIKSSKGYFTSSIPPYGYYLEKGKLYKRNDNTPEIVQRIFKEYLSGKGFDAIARKLYEEGIPTPSQIAGKANASDKWHGSTVRAILENPHYVGDLVQGRSETVSVTSKKRKYKSENEFIIIKNTHEPIISREEFLAVQQLIKSRRRIRLQQQIHLFTNILFCADCGHGMHYKKNRKGYICGSYNKHGSKACNEHLIKEDELKTIILNDIKSLISKLDNEKFIKTIEVKVKTNIDKLEKQVKNYKKEIENLKAQKRKALNKFINEEINKEDYDMFISETNKKINNLTKVLEKNQTIINDISKNFSLKDLDNLKNMIINIKELTPDILNRFIERIEIKADGTPKIFYRFSGASVYFSALSINTQHSTWAV
ncbi:recombinase family protein [Caloramator sp. CAR-1]|uniref:recombinase family protein n=1 Tax=Caloramator sp. CAR-1 TaxID=3062777 RepID=UPI0026E26350|nr:recombinase family protein [Caloramator sp. CAR-1]MDO6354968.1 recombinase family protein [Caloramator sp. CAR-1]